MYLLEQRGIEMENKKRLTIAIIMGDTYTEYANELINGFYSCAKMEEVNLIFLMRSSLPRDTNAVLSDMAGDDFQVRFSSIYDYVPLIKPDALILAYGSLNIFSDTPSKKDLLSYYEGIPCLLLKALSDDPNVPHLVADNYVGMCSCIEHLVTVHNYKKIAFLSGPSNNHDANERLRAYYDIMQKYGLPVTDSMVAYGDYSESVDAQVMSLLDSNPGLEAIAFANDNMAKAGYRICNARGLVVGRDIAITGFDDVNFAKTLNPPLTSVMHNSFLYSYQALKNAIQLCNGSAVTYQTLPTVFHARSSCGCTPSYATEISVHATGDEFRAFIQSNIDYMVDDFFFSYPYAEDKKQYKDHLMGYFDYILENIFERNCDKYNFTSLAPYLKKLCENPRISPLIMLDYILQLLRKLVPYAPDACVHDALLRIIASSQQYVLSTEILALQSKAQMNLHQNWFSNSFTQNLLASELSFEESLLCIVNRLKLMNIRSCYFCLLSEPATCEVSYHLQLPDNLYLAAYYDGDTTVHMEREKWIHIDREKGLSDILPQDKINLLTTYVLFSGKTQYGLLLCESDPQDISFMSTCSLQIGSFLRFFNLNENEHRIRKELEASLQQINEQNSILNFISEYDELTKLLNRRGFMEKAFQAINENIGKTAYVIFFDLDHLKEINDCFGHSAGDFSLQTVAELLAQCLPDNAILARIGGDEFVSFVISDVEDFEQQAKSCIENTFHEFNQASNKPYYIEVSLGICKCSCSSTASITDLLDQSDALLYVDKTHRRFSAKKIR